MGRIIPYIMENKKCAKPPTPEKVFIILYARKIFRRGAYFPTQAATQRFFFLFPPKAAPPLPNLFLDGILFDNS